MRLQVRANCTAGLSNISGRNREKIGKIGPELCKFSCEMSHIGNKKPQAVNLGQPCLPVRRERESRQRLSSLVHHQQHLHPAIGYSKMTDSSA